MSSWSDIAIYMVQSCSSSLWQGHLISELGTRKLGGGESFAPAETMSAVESGLRYKFRTFRAHVYSIEHKNAAHVGLPTHTAAAWEVVCALYLKRRSQNPNTLRVLARPVFLPQSEGSIRISAFATYAFGVFASRVAKIALQLCHASLRVHIWQCNDRLMHIHEIRHNSHNSGNYPSSCLLLKTSFRRLDSVSALRWALLSWDKLVWIASLSARR
jgi:hypothetical protein